MTLEQSSELEDCLALERSPKTTNGSSGVATGALPPETLLRRLARSISTRLTYKRCLHEQATQRLSDLDKETDVVRQYLPMCVKFFSKKLPVLFLSRKMLLGHLIPCNNW